VQFSLHRFKKKKSPLLVKVLNTDLYFNPRKI